jgi:transcriptional regulator with XRE-family HTH domain
MRRLTLKGYLKSELARLSGVETASIRRLATLLQKDRPRLAEPLLLFAALTGRTGLLLSSLAAGWPLDEYREVLRLFPSEEALLHGLETGDTRLPERYRKTYASYFHRANRHSHDLAVSAQIRERTLQKLEEKQLKST